MKKIEIINVKTPEMPKDHQVTDLNEIYFARQNIKEESINDYFGEIQVGIIPQEIDMVVVGDMERTRLKDVKVIFLLGMKINKDKITMN